MTQNTGVKKGVDDQSSLQTSENLAHLNSEGIPTFLEQRSSKP